MNNQILERISFDSDIRNHRELSPFIFFTHSSIYSTEKSKLNRIKLKDYHHSTLNYDTINTIENKIYSKDFYKNDPKEIDGYKESILRKLRYFFDIRSRSAIENLFTIQNDVIYDLLNDCQYFMSKYKKKIKRDLMQMPISTAQFPHYHQLTTNYFFYDDHSFEINNNDIINNEQKLSEIINNYFENDKDTKNMIPFNDLLQFLNILSDNAKAFSFSPTFVLTMIENFDNFLNTLFHTHNPKDGQNNENTSYDFILFGEIKKLPINDENRTKIKYFLVIMLIKMLLYLIIQKIHEALSILLQFIILDQDNFDFDLDDQFSFKSIFEKSLPHTTRRSKIIQNISTKQIIDFCCTAKGNNDFILTKNGIYEIDQTGELNLIECNSKSFEKEDKIAFSDGILYILKQEDKEIHKILIKNENVNESKNKETNQREIKKQSNSKANKKKRLSKKLREKQKKEKKAQRKEERKQIENDEIRLDSLSIDVPELPIISMSVYNNYVRILQRKNYNNNETTFVLTNIDMTPNSRTNFNVFEAFEKVDNEKQINQTSVEITVSDKSNKYKLFDACLSEDVIFFTFEDSSFEQWMIFKDGTASPFKRTSSPYLFTSNSRVKMDNDSFLHVMESTRNDENESVCLIKMYLPETKFYIRSKNDVLMKYSYLQKLSDIVDNCSHLIINREVTKAVTSEEYYEVNDSRHKKEKKMKKEKPIQNPFSFVVSPEEMSTIVQSPTAIAHKLDELKALIKEIKDKELQLFFISLFVKMCGVNLLYGVRGLYSSKEKLSDEMIKQRFGKFKSFILDLYSLSKLANSSDYEVILKESFIFTLSIAGKFLFLPDQYDNLHCFFNELISSNDECTKFLLRTLSYFIFTYPSSLFIINDSLIDKLLEYDNVDIQLSELFMKNIILVFLESRFARKLMTNEFIEYLYPYIQSVFKYIRSMLMNDSIPLIISEQLLSYFMSIDISAIPHYSSMMLKEVVNIAPYLYDRIKREPGVLESDKEFLERHNDILPQTVHKEIKVLESDHPYNNSKANVIDEEKDSKGNVIEDLGSINFGSNIDTIYAVIDPRCKISEHDKIIIHCNNEVTEFKSNTGIQTMKFESNRLHVKLLKSKETCNGPCWGYKISFVGISFDMQFDWISNEHLAFYSCFICFLSQVFSSAFDSTKLNQNEKDLKSLVNGNIIQGIKFEEIRNEELIKGISKGISFDIDNEIAFDDDQKKTFLNEIINANNENDSIGKKFLDIMYSKTAKKNRIRLNEATKSILVNERYLTACLLKHLGLINSCLKFINKEEEVEVPSRLISLWKKVYSLRQTLFFSYQKSKITVNSSARNNDKSIKFDFKKYSEEIKNKCILLLYSSPILELKEKSNFDDEKIESVTSSIFSFITSETTLSAVSDLVDACRKRLSLRTQSLLSFSKFCDHFSLFETSKMILANQVYNFSTNSDKLVGVTEKEYDDYHILYDQVIYKMLKKLFTDPSTALISKIEFVGTFLFMFENDKDGSNQLSKIFIDIIENKKIKSFIRDEANLQMIIILFSLALRNKNSEIVDYISSLLFCDYIDFTCKKLILTIIPVMIKMIPGNHKIKDKSLAISFLKENSNLPVLVCQSFYWIATLLNLYKDEKEDYDFIMTVLKGIGQAFVGKSCLFIDNEAFKSFTHRQVADKMISFIRLLMNSDNDSVLNVIHDVLSNKINQLRLDENNDDLMISIGMFSSIGQSLSAFEPERQFGDFLRSSDLYQIIGFNPALCQIREMYSYRRKTNGNFENIVKLDPKKLDLNEKEINNLLQLHKIISKSKYFIDEQQKYDYEITDKEIAENILFSSFYSFLPIIMQNKNNAGILMSNKYLDKTLSLFEFSTKSLPSNENSLLLLSHYLENAINNPMYKPKNDTNENRIDSNGCFRFMKMNFGEIVYGNLDVIKTDGEHFNLFLSSRPFDAEHETYFEIKINEIGNKRIFIGFVDSEELSIDKAFGFGCAGQSDIFCRRSANLSKHIEFSCDKIMKNDQIPPKLKKEDNSKEDGSINNCIENVSKKVFSLNKGDRIGCYYTFNYVYLTLNGALTKYRLSHKSVNSYIPIISVDHDEVELEITQNVSFVDNSKFDFLNIKNVPVDYFKEKDIKKSIRLTDSLDTSGDFSESNFMIGQVAFLERTIVQEKYCMLETIEPISEEILRERENFAIIKDITPLNENRLVSKLNIESYNHLTLSKEIYKNVDSRYLTYKKTNFFNLIENRTNTKLGINNTFNLKYLPKDLQTTTDFNSISLYLRTKTIKDNSKSIAIIMTRFLVFVLVDYLRYIKSPLLQDEGIDSNEMNCILHSLAASLPTITSFRPKFVYKLEDKFSHKYVIFQDEDEYKEATKNSWKKEEKPFYVPIISKAFDISFKMFIQKSQNFLSTKFVSKLLQISMDKVISSEIIPISSLYSSLPAKCKVESIDSLPEKFEYETTIKKKRLKNSTHVVGFIPILLNEIPSQLPDVECKKKSYRQSSNQVSYFSHVKDDIEISWKYKIKDIKEPFDLDKYTDYKLKFGLLLLTKNLPENLLNSSLGFIQNLLNVFQSFENSDKLFDKFKEFLRGDLLEKIFTLAMKKDPIAHPFIQIILVMLISKYGFSDSMFIKNASNAMFIFKSISNKLYQLNDFPTGKNELPLLFSIYSNLIQTRIYELLADKQNKETLSTLFDKYNEINKELFMIDNDENESDENSKKNNKNNGFELAVNEKKKNFRLLYLLYYYSYLLHNDQCLPYPMFLFIHDWMMQRFGGFRTTISKKEINRFKRIKIDENKEIIYKSDILENDFDLCCSYKLFNIYVKKEDEDDKKSSEKDKKKKEEKNIKEANKVFIHQLKDDKQIELPQTGEEVTVSFPLEIIIVHEEDKENKTKELKLGDVYIFDFCPSEDTQRSCFIDNYDQIQNEFQQFISYEKYDTQIMESFNSSEKNDKDDSNENNNNNNNDSNEEDDNSDNENNNVEIGNKDDYKIYEIQQIHDDLIVSLSNLALPVDNKIASLRFSMISLYRFLIENQIVAYAIDNDKDKKDDDDDDSNYTNWWRTSSYSDAKAPNRYMQQIVGPAYSMSTESKFIFIDKIFKSETKEDYELRLIFNRFEQQKFFDKNKDKSVTSVRPLFIQFMEQLDEESIPLLKVRGGLPFHVNLVGEGAIDGGGPGREIFSSLIVEMMNDKLGIFTYNPNRLHENKDTNKEDLIPNKNIISENFSEEAAKLLEKRFVYAGALIAACIVSSLPQTMNLSSFIWEYLTNGNVSIESIYEIDEDFKQLIQNAESLEKRINSISDDEFNKCFYHFFEIKDSFDNVIELIPSGSKVLVTKENLHEFIQLSKKQRINEFNDELKDLKEGFDKIMIYNNITSILRPNELKLLVCGEMSCSVERMKKIIDVSTPSLYNEKFNEEQMIEMFWKVIESFSIEDRMQFIRFSSGNLGLPAPGLKWEDNISVIILSRERKEKRNENMVTSSTCSSETRIPFFETEEELAKMIKISLKFFGMITDGRDELEDVSKDLF